NGFAMDVQRYLADEPVQACPRSVGYRLGKFARRHRGAVAAVAAVTLALLLGTALAIWQAIEATRARDDALRAAAAETAAKETASAKEKETQAVLDFVVQRIIAAARPKGREGGLGSEVSLRAAIEAALPFVEKS